MLKGRSMNKVKLRRTLVSVHLYLAALLAPAFLLVAISGGLYLADVKGGTSETALPVPAGFTLDADDPALETRVRDYLASADVDVSFDYLRARGGNVTTRPTSRRHVRFESEDGVMSATLVQPDPLNAMMELHKGHGPAIFRTFGIIMGIALFLVVTGGMIVGLLAPGYRRQTIWSALAGSAVFGWLALFA